MSTYWAISAIQAASRPVTRVALELDEEVEAAALELDEEVEAAALELDEKEDFSSPAMIAASVRK